MIDSELTEEERLRAAAEYFGVSVEYLRQQPKHEADCSLNTTHHLVCSCGAYYRRRAVSE